MFWAKGIACTMALRQACGWHVGGAEEAVWLECSEQRRKGEGGGDGADGSGPCGLWGGLGLLSEKEVGAVEGCGQRRDGTQDLTQHPLALVGSTDWGE